MHFIGQLLISLKCTLRHIGPVVFWPAPRSRGSSQIQLVDANHRSAGGCHWTRQNQSDASIHPMRDHISSNIQSDYFIACRWLVRQETRIILTKQQTCDTLQIPVIRGYDSFQLCKTAARFARLIDQDERMVSPALPPSVASSLPPSLPLATQSLSSVWDCGKTNRNWHSRKEHRDPHGRSSSATCARIARKGGAVTHRLRSNRLTGLLQRCKSSQT
jgi:hypothetical protein